MHWGADLGDLAPEQLEALADAQSPAVPPSSIDEPLRLSLLPLLGEGWTGRQGIAGRRAIAGSTSLSLRLTAIDRRDATSAVVRMDDASEFVTVSLELRLDPSGLLATRATVTNAGAEGWEPIRVAVTLPVPARATELLDFGGRWSFERRPQRRPFSTGAWSREQRHGRTGHDAPYLTVAGTAGFGFRHGEVWALHVATSGDHEVVAESASSGHASLAAAELLAPGEVSLAPGESYAGPQVLAAWSDGGLDGVSARFHQYLRTRHPLPVRPVICNTWEAVYFDHDLPTLVRLAELAASVGVERFVLDDGWMSGRIDDTRALGDWVVDATRWPDGLHPLVATVTGLGMEFGLWVEPEMVSLDSDVARAHPEWVIRPAGIGWRHQHVLDLGDDDAFAHVLGQLDALLDEYPIAYLKWDQNRDMLAGSTHRQIAATARMMDELRRRHPGLEIESCSSGGGRIDLGILEHTDRVWVSDTNDPLERQAIQRYTSLLVPTEYLGSHLGAGTAHVTGRATDLGFRLATALFASAGIEWDLTAATPDELDAVRSWVAVYTSLRGLLHSGAVVRAEAADPGIEVHGVVAADGSDAVFSVVCLTAPRDAVFSVVLPGLEPDAAYRVSPVELGTPPRVIQSAPPRWMDEGAVTLTGRALESVGLAMPALAPAQALVLRVTRVG